MIRWCPQAHRCYYCHLVAKVSPKRHFHFAAARVQRDSSKHVRSRHYRCNKIHPVVLLNKEQVHRLRWHCCGRFFNHLRRHIVQTAHARIATWRQGISRYTLITNQSLEAALQEIPASRFSLIAASILSSSASTCCPIVTAASTARVSKRPHIYRGSLSPSQRCSEKSAGARDPQNKLLMYTHAHPESTAGCDSKRSPLPPIQKRSAVQKEGSRRH